MLSVIMQYWIWMTLAVGLGVLVALLSFSYKSKSVFNSVMIWGAVIFAVSLIGAIANMVGGRAGFYLEVALLLVACYFVGSLVGGLFTGNFSPRYSGWWVGLILVALIGAVSIIFARTDIEKDIRVRTGIAMERAGGNAFDFDVAGRDVFLHLDVGSPEKRTQLADIILNLPGVRLVSEVPNFTGEAAEVRAKALAEISIRETAAKAASEKAAQEAAAKAALKKAAQEAAAKAASKKATQEAATKAASEKVAQEADATAASERMAQEATARVMAERASQCQAELSALKSRELVTFKIGSAVISDRFDVVLKKIKTILAHCPSARIEVSGHTDTSGAESFNESLSQKRAQAGIDYLLRAGVETSRLIAAGYGESLPFKSNATRQGRILNRRIEFSVR